MKNITDKSDNTAGADGQLTAGEYNDHKNELQNAVTGSDQTLTPGLGTDEEQLIKGIANHATGGAAKYEDNGVANAYEVDPVSGFTPPDSIREGMIIHFFPANNNSGAITIDYNGEGPVAGKDVDGNDFTGGEIVNSRLASFYRNGSEWWAVGTSAGGGGGSGFSAKQLTINAYKNIKPFVDIKSKFGFELETTGARGPKVACSPYGGWMAVGQESGGDPRAIGVPLVSASVQIPAAELSTITTLTSASGDLYDVAWGNGFYVAVGGTGGGDALIATSSDFSFGFTERANPNNTNLRAVAYSPSLGMFAAVGDYDGTDMYVITSTDNGATWTERAAAGAAASGDILWDITWSESAGYFVAVGNDSSANGLMYTSTDGITWTYQSKPSGADGNTAVAWCEGLGVFVKAAYESGAIKIHTASDPTGTWTATATLSTDYDEVQKIAFSTEQDIVALQTENGRVLLSEDATDWVEAKGYQAHIENSVFTPGGIAFSEYDNMFYVASTDVIHRSDTFDVSI